VTDRWFCLSDRPSFIASFLPFLLYSFLHSILHFFLYSGPQGKSSPVCANRIRRYMCGSHPCRSRTRHDTRLERPRSRRIASIARAAAGQAHGINRRHGRLIASMWFREDSVVGFKNDPPPTNHQPPNQLSLSLLSLSLSFGLNESTSPSSRTVHLRGACVLQCVNEPRKQSTHPPHSSLQETGWIQALASVSAALVRHVGDFQVQQWSIEGSGECWRLQAANVTSS
jgi:hypothetical protein